MARRPVFTVTDRAPYYGIFEAEFPWAGGLSLSQKRKNVDSIHRCYENAYAGKVALEISSKSTKAVGNAASAFFLKKHVPSLGRGVPVECVFQSSKVFSGGGPFTDLLEVEPIRAKKDERLQSSGRLIGFTLEGVSYPTEPKTIFYDYIYIQALLENPHIAQELCGYDGFTDIAFNPEKSLNCQARSAAIFVSLSKLGLLDRVKDFPSFLALFEGEEAVRRVTASTARATATSFERVNVLAADVGGLVVGCTVIHKLYGRGRVTSLSGQTAKILFDSVGEKKTMANYAPLTKIEE